MLPVFRLLPKFPQNSSINILISSNRKCMGMASKSGKMCISGNFYPSAFLAEWVLSSSVSVCPSVCLHHPVSATPERLNLHSPYLHKICIMVGARPLFIMGDLDLHLEGHGLDLQDHNTLLAQWLQNNSSYIHICTRYASWWGQEPYLSWVSLTFIFKAMTLTLTPWLRGYRAIFHFLTGNTFRWTSLKLVLAN